MKITKVEVQAKHKDRVNVYVDDEFYAGLDMDTCVKHNIKAGVEVDDSYLSGVVLEAEKQKALGRAAKYMGKALKTTRQIKQYLAQKGYSEDVINYCIAKLKEYKYLDDENYARAYIKDNYTRIGIIKIKHMLSTKGVPDSIIENVLAEYELQEDVLMRLALKKLKNKPITYENLTKTMVFLSNRGFEYDDIKKVINKLKEENIDESWD